ncbi:MAG: SMC-Scp complex subunit ScpB [Deltaproteobacteria bacterium]
MDDDGEKLKRAIEALVFASDKPVAADGIARALDGASRDDIEQRLWELVAEWEGLGRGFRLVRAAGGFQFRTLPDFAEAVLKLRQAKPFRLGRAAVEVLSIVAYRQPITRIEIDHIRGVDSSGVVGALMEKRLIHIKGRRDVIGKPFLYSTTPEFLEVFGIDTLADLPTLREIEEIERGIERKRE